MIQAMLDAELRYDFLLSTYPHLSASLSSSQMYDLYREKKY